MDIKNLYKTTKIIGAYMLLLLLFSCPGNDDCFDLGSATRVDDLILLIPEQTNYNQGDTVTLNVTIPSVNTYYGNEIDLYNATGDVSARLVTNSYLFVDNTLNFIKGSQSTETNWFNMPYNPETGNYELEVQVQLNRAGDYSFTSADIIEFIGDECNRYRLDTNIQWSVFGIIEFTVNE